VIFYYMTMRYYTYYLFPFLLVLLDLTLGRVRRNWRLWLPFFILAAIKFSAVKAEIFTRVSFLDSLGAQAVKSHIYAVYSFYSHLWLLLWPQKLTLFHEVGSIPVSIFKYGLLYLIPIFLSLIFTFKKARELFLGLGIFIIFLSPTYSPIPISSLIAERYIYLPSLFLSIFLAYLYQRYSSRRAALRNYLIFIMVVIASAYTVRTAIRNEDYRGPERFWAQTLRVSMNNWQAHSNMGFIYLTKGRTQEAIGEYEKTIKLHPKSADLYNNLAVAYHKTGKVAEAEYYFQKAIEVNPDSAYAHINLAIIYCRQAKLSLAIQHYDKAVRLGYKNIPQELLEKLKP
ncbi:MAG: tetratricopeptide repeat protein, partial [Candidatus Omnitrophota bacterium]